MSLFIMSKVKKLCLLMSMILLAFALVFGYFYYQYTPDYIIHLLSQLFNKDNNYYLISSLLFLFIHTYLSSSYIGFIGSGLLIFIKGLQIIYSILYINSNTEFTLLVFLSLCIKILLEIISTFIITIQCMELSCFIFYSIFQNKTHISIKNILNNQINIIIFGLITIFISLYLT